MVDIKDNLKKKNYVSFMLMLNFCLLLMNISALCPTPVTLEQRGMEPFIQRGSSSNSSNSSTDQINVSFGFLKLEKTLSIAKPPA